MSMNLSLMVHTDSSPSPLSSQFNSTPFSSVGSTPRHLLSELSLRSPISSSSPWCSYQWLQDHSTEERGIRLVSLLTDCATYVSNDDMEHATACLDQISDLATLTGGPMQRVATYFMKALATRMIKSSPPLYKALNSTRLPAAAAELENTARSLFFDLCPFLKVAFIAVSHTVLEAVQAENFVHIIDLDASHPEQWVPLLRGLFNRPGGPPHLQITAVNEQKHVLDRTAQRLTEVAGTLNLSFQFNPVACGLHNLGLEMLRIKPGEAIAVSSVLQLHALLADEDDRSRFSGRDGGFENQQRPPSQVRGHSLAEFLDRERRLYINSARQFEAEAARRAVPPPSQKINRLFRLLRSLSPKVLTIVEQDSNLNGPVMSHRFMEALNFYSSLFDSLNQTLSPQQSAERLMLEKYLLGQQILNIVACEGVERVERHEDLERWIKRLDGAGFEILPLSSTSISMANAHLRSYPSDAYRFVPEWGCLTLCWHNRPLFSVSAWKKL